MYQYEVTTTTYNYTVTIKTFTYIGDQGKHKGYYCGGHLVLEEYGTVYSFTYGELNSIDGAYGDKNRTNENQDETLPEYVVRATDALCEGETVADEARMAEAQDLFDIDANLIHYQGLVHKDFPGWSEGSIDNAVAKFLEDWEKAYGIKTHYTIAGLDADVIYNSGTDSYADADGNPVIGTRMTQEEIDAVIAALEANPDYVNDSAWPARKNTIIQALSYVGCLGYSQNHHSDALRVGGLTDCSGFASNVWKPYFGDIINTGGFLNLGSSCGTSHPFYADKGQGEYQAKPGDVLIRGTVSGERHAVVYVGIVNGTTMSVDIGGAPGCRYMHKNYYGQCTVIDMGSTLGLN